MIKNGEKTKDKDLLDILFEARDEDGCIPKDENITDMWIGVVLAGVEEPAYGMMWSIIYLTQHPHILKKAKVN